MIFKDQLFLFWIQKNLEKTSAGSVFHPQKLIVWPGYIEAEHFEVKKHRNAFDGLELSGEGRALIKFSTLSLLKDPVLALREAHIFMKNLHFSGLAADGISVEVFKNRSGNYLDSHLEIKTLSFRQTESRDLKGRFKVGRDFILFDDIDGLALGGRVSCGGRLVFGKNGWALDLKVHLDRIGMMDLLKAFQAGKGVKASGVFSGDVTMTLEKGVLRNLKGELNSIGGGEFIVADMSLLDKNLNGTQGANIVVENLKNYHYDIGNIQIQKEDRDIRMNILLQGQAGSRSLEVIWHGPER